MSFWQEWRSVIWPSLIILLGIGLNEHLEFGLFHEKKWVLLTFFIFLAFVGHRIINFSKDDHQIKFPFYYLSTMIVRLIASGLFVLFIVYSGLENIPLFVFNFFSMYFLYFVFEIYHLLGNLQANSKSDRKNGLFGSKTKS